MNNSKEIKLDDTDKKILDILQDDASYTNVELAKMVGISPPGMLERVKRLKNSGVIKKYVVIVDPPKVGTGIFAIISVSLTAHQLPSIDHFIKAINKMEEVMECYHVTGEYDFLLKVAAKDIQSYEKFILEKLTRIKGVNRINTSFILSAFKQETKLKVEINERG